jgi:hypothetical protein
VLWKPKVHYHVHNGLPILKPCVADYSPDYILKVNISSIACVGVKQALEELFSSEI